MNSPKYVPVFRSKQEEMNVLKSFDFGNEIYPCLEIIREYKDNKEDLRQVSLLDDLQLDSFQKKFLPIINEIRAKKVFIDLPVHLESIPNMKGANLLFLQNVIYDMNKRTDYIKKFSSISDKVIPVISTFYKIEGERNTIVKQEKQLRQIFNELCFRTFLDSYESDLEMISKVALDRDYLIIDIEESEIDLSYTDLNEIKSKVRHLPCTIILHQNTIPLDFKMSGINHGYRIDSIDNSLVYYHDRLGATAFSDYVSVKKDLLTDGGVHSPGFIFYDASSNNFYGYRYKHGGHRKNQNKPELSEFEDRIVPSVIRSPLVSKMNDKNPDYLNSKNLGWKILNNIYQGNEPGKTASKFKRISMLHYLHCIKTKIINKEI